MAKSEIKQRRKVVIHPTTDTFVQAIHWGGNRACLVHRREHGGRTFIRLRTWNFHQTKHVWYPTKRGYIIPLDEAGDLADAIMKGADGLVGEKPAWLLQYEAEEVEYRANRMT